MAARLLYRKASWHSSSKYYSTLFGRFCNLDATIASTRTITYQRDVGLHNLKEVSDLMNQANSIHNVGLNFNILKASTVFAQEKWTTARDENGKIVGCCMATNVGDSFRTAGYISVSPAYRGSDVGYRVVEVAGACEVDAQRSLVGTYIGISKKVTNKTIGKHFPQYNTDFKYIGQTYKTDFKEDLSVLPSSGQGFHVQRLTRGRLFDRLVQFDTGVIHEVPRRNFLEVFLDPEVASTFVAVDDLSGRVLGYGTLQPAFNPNVIMLGPLYAASENVAAVLVKEILSNVPRGKFLRIIHNNENKFMNNIVETILDVANREVHDELFHFHTDHAVSCNHEHNFCFPYSSIVLV